MKKLSFSTVIHAPKEKVWETMLQKDTYEKWVSVFYEGSTYEGNWEKGSEMRFVGPHDEGGVSGMYALIEENRPYEFISIKHLGEFTNDVKTPFSTAEGQEGYENYTFTEVEEGTEVRVDLSIPSEWEEMFTDMWPRALASLKEMVEG